MSTTESVPYASRVSNAASPIVAAAVLIGAGLGLMGLGGCFLIGVMIVVTRFNIGTLAIGSGVVMTAGEIMLVVVLYVMSFVCLIGSLAILVPAILRLFRVMGTGR